MSQASPAADKTPLSLFRRAGPGAGGKGLVCVVGGEQQSSDTLTDRDKLHTFALTLRHVPQTLPRCFLLN